MVASFVSPQFHMQVHPLRAQPGDSPIEIHLQRGLTGCIAVCLSYNMAPGVVTQVVQGISALASVWLIKSIVDAEKEKTVTRFSQCPTCNGSRRVPCMCTRWSDNDVGCNTCAGSGMMRCNSCGGSGTGRPIPVEIRASNPPRNPWLCQMSLLLRNSKTRWHKSHFVVWEFQSAFAAFLSHPYQNNSVENENENLNLAQI